MIMEKTPLNRFTSNHILWLEHLKELCTNRGDTELIPFIKETLFNAKKVLPDNVQERSGLSHYKTLQELTDMNDVEFGKMCLYFANASIYDTGVFSDNLKYVYFAKVDNTVLLYPLLLADFLVTTKVFRETNTGILVIVIDEVKDTDENPFVYLMKTVFKEYYKDVPVQFVG